MSDKLDQLLRDHAREVPRPSVDHEAVFFARLARQSMQKTRRNTGIVLTGVLAAAAAWFFMIYNVRQAQPSAEVVQIEESVESYNALLDDDEDFYSMLAMTP